MFSNCTRRLLPTISPFDLAIHQGIGIGCLIRTIGHTLDLFSHYSASSLLSVVLNWLVIVVIGYAFYLGYSALQTLDEKQLIHFGSAVVIGLLLQLLIWLLWKPDTLVQENTLKTWYYITLDVLCVAIQVVLAVFAFTFAKRPSVLLTV